MPCLLRKLALKSLNDLNSAQFRFRDTHTQSHAFLKDRCLGTSTASCRDPQPKKQFQVRFRDSVGFFFSVVSDRNSFELGPLFPA